MNGSAVSQLQKQYQQLRSQRDAGRMSQADFLAQVHKLQTQDASGRWWTIDPVSGGYLWYDGVRWVAGTPAGLPKRGLKMPRINLSAGILPWLKRNGSRIAIIMPLATAGIWFLWGALHPLSEGVDCLTPLIMAGVPIGLILFQKQIDPLLVPIQPYRKHFPKAMLLGASLALPVVLGLVCSTITVSGFGVIRLTLFASMLGAHILLREPALSV